jgi:hypothetical protein
VEIDQHNIPNEGLSPTSGSAPSGFIAAMCHFAPLVCASPVSRFAYRLIVACEMPISRAIVRHDCRRARRPPQFVHAGVLKLGAAADAALLARRSEAGVDALADQLAFELGEASEDRRTACRARRQRCRSTRRQA